MPAVKVYLEVHGCWLSKAEGEIARSLLEKAGYTVSSDARDADAIVVVTCAVRGDTEVAMLKRLRELREKAPHARFVVAGCLVNVRPKSILSITPEAALVEPDALDHVVDALESRDPVYIVRKYQRNLSILPEYRGGPTYVVPIESGCTGSCSFCVEWVARGRQVKSYPVESIVKAVKEAVARGAREIYLTGQDVASYGIGSRSSLPELVETLLEEVQGRYRIRLGMMEPIMTAKIAEKLLPLFKDERLYRYFHLPAQSGDDQVLRLMRRRYTVSAYEELVAKIRSSVGTLSLATDIIVGFPGESDESFRNTLSFIERLRFDKVHVARYTLRPFTLGYVSYDNIPEHVKKARSREASSVALRIAAEVNRSYVGRTVEVLINGTSFRGDVAGRTPEYKLVIMKGYHVQPGEFVKARIVGATALHLIGEVVD
ncbi:MAG: tRNA (N(6)-L-threonylcarbamoyladenosine(37)-C(2))-methylthiotransferase [Thermofilum sp.]